MISGVPSKQVIGFNLSVFLRVLRDRKINTFFKFAFVHWSCIVMRFIRFGKFKLWIWLDVNWLSSLQDCCLASRNKQLIMGVLNNFDSGAKISFIYVVSDMGLEKRITEKFWAFLMMHDLLKMRGREGVPIFLWGAKILHLLTLLFVIWISTTLNLDIRLPE